MMPPLRRMNMNSVTIPIPALLGQTITDHGLESLEWKPKLGMLSHDITLHCEVGNAKISLSDKRIGLDLVALAWQKELPPAVDFVITEIIEDLEVRTSGYVKPGKTHPALLRFAK